MPDLHDLKELGAPPGAWDTERILPEGFLPMLPTPATGPLDSGDYAYEPKWEGLRVLVALAGDRLELRTVSGQPAGFWFPELHGASGVRRAAQPSWIVLDGELVVCGEGRVQPALVQERLRPEDSLAVEQMAARQAATLVLYDILRIGDSWLLDVSWEDRREILERTVRPGERVRLSPVHGSGAAAASTAASMGLHSVVARRLKGRYTPGEKTRDWLSIRPLDVTECRIGGWMEGRGARGGTIGSLLLGVDGPDGLVYVGHTGTGIDGQTLPALHRELLRRHRATSPFSQEPRLAGEPHWTRPDLSCRIRHQGWGEGGKLRSPTFLGMVSPLARSARVAR